MKTLTSPCGRSYTQFRTQSISAELNGETFSFEIKFTRSEKRYFGAATLTECIAAIENAERFRFVIAYEREASWVFEEYTVEEFMVYSYIPPFKVFFNIPLGGGGNIAGKRTRRVQLTHERLSAMRELFRAFREEFVGGPDSL